MRKKILSSLLVLGLFGCSDLGDEGWRSYSPLLVEITSAGIKLTNDTPLTVYYDWYPSGCDACGHGICMNPDTCYHVLPYETTVLEYQGGYATVRWWHLIPNDEGTGYIYDDVRYVMLGP